MRWMIVGPRIVQNHDGLGAEQWKVMGCPKLSIFDVRLLGGIAVALIAFVTLLIPEPLEEPPQFSYRASAIL